MKKVILQLENDLFCIEELLNSIYFHHLCFHHHFSFHHHSVFHHCFYVHRHYYDVHLDGVDDIHLSEHGDDAMLCARVPCGADEQLCSDGDSE